MLTTYIDSSGYTCDIPLFGEMSASAYLDTILGQIKDFKNSIFSSQDYMFELHQDYLNNIATSADDEARYAISDVYNTIVMEIYKAMNSEFGFVVSNSTDPMIFLQDITDIYQTFIVSDNALSIINNLADSTIVDMVNACIDAKHNNIALPYNSDDAINAITTFLNDINDRSTDIYSSDALNIQILTSVGLDNMVDKFTSGEILCNLYIQFIYPRIYKLSLTEIAYEVINNIRWGIENAK